MKRAVLGFVAVGSVLGAACGGGGGGNSGGPGGGGQTNTNYGAVSVTSLSALAAPVIVTTPGYTLLGMGGSTITSAWVNFPPVTQAAPEVMFDNSMLIASVANYPTVIDLNAERAFPLHNSGGSSSDTQPSFYKGGPRVLTSEFDSTTGTNQIFSTHRDGQGRIAKTASAGMDFHEPADLGSLGFVSVDQSTGQGHLYRFAMDSMVPVRMWDDGGDYRRPTLSPDSSKLVFIRVAGDGVETIMTGNPDGSGTPEELFTSGAPGKILLSWLPDGNLLAAIDQSGTTEIRRINLTSGPVGVPGYVASSFQSMAVAPDGITVAVSDGTSTLQKLSLANYSLRPFIELDGIVGSIAWSRYEPIKYLVGPNSWYTPQAGGFLLTQQYSRVGSYVTYNSANPSGITITSHTSNPLSGTIVCTVEASDQLTSLKYTASGVSFFPTEVLNSSRTAKGAIISFNAQDGAVASVITYSSSSSLSDLTRTTEGNTITFRGKFNGVWNAKGENTYSGGATTVKIDSKTGVLSTFE